MSAPVKVFIWEGLPPWNPPILPHLPGCNPWAPNLHHQGVLVFGHFYEFGYDGVKKIPAGGSNWTSFYKEGPWVLIYERVMGETHVPQTEFDAWVDSIKRSKFTAEKFCTATNPNHHFAVEVCNFLCVTYPLEWDSNTAWREVEVVVWDLSSGLANSFVSQMALALLTGFESPDGIYHAGVIYCGYLYEYSKEGIRKSRAAETGDPKSCCQVGAMKYRQVMGIGQKGLGTFDQWIANAMAGKFRGSNYCVSRNQCIHFAIEACKELGLYAHPDWELLCKLTVNSPGIVKLVESADNKSQQPLLSKSEVRITIANDGIKFSSSSKIYREKNR